MKKKKSYNSFNFNNETHVKFDDDGYLIYASGLSSILWCEDPDNIDKIIVDKHMHITEFSELLHKYGGNKRIKEGFDNIVIKGFEKGVRKRERKSKILSLFRK